MDKWTELRTALFVAKLGTVSAAADALDIHRATVNRHVDALEEALGARIFLRHARGYTLTEAGEDVLRVAQKADDLVSDMSSRVQGRSTRLEGEIKVTLLPNFANVIMEPLVQFRQENPGCRVTVQASEDLARLEYAEAHIALRAGPKPENPDYVVQSFGDINIGLYAHRSYLARHPAPQTVAELSDHAFILAPDATRGRAPFWEWVDQHVPAGAVAVASEHYRVREEATFGGLGVGFLTAVEAQGRADMDRVLPEAANWSVPLWLVAHVDLHRTEKVQAMLACIKAHARRG